MAESVKVVVRCRPMNNREHTLKCKSVVVMDSERCCCSLYNPAESVAPPKTFTFDGVYSPTSTTEQLYNESVYPLIEGVLEGYNSTVFAYGQTGCGKSFSMQGVSEPVTQRGIIPRAFEHIFEAIAVAQDIKYLVLASYLEIYNEEIRDLLGPDIKKKLELKESGDRGVYVQDLTWHAVGSVADCEKLMVEGWSQRATGATLMNADSSRSHSVFSVCLEMMDTRTTSQGTSSSIRKGKLSLVDLAGSERQAKTGAMGERLKEASKINLSLSALGNVISALVDGKAKHIPYRDSKLTRLLQDSLGGNTKTLMVACLSPADNNYDESLSTLRYANRAKNICNKPQINEDPKDAMLRQYQEEIDKLKAMLSSTTAPKFAAVVDEAILQKEREKLREEYEREMTALREQYNEVTSSKVQVQEELEKLKTDYDNQVKNLNKKSVFKQQPLTIVDGETKGEDEEPIVNCNGDTSPNGNTNVPKPSRQEILARLAKLQRSLVGGEKAGDISLKERRARRKREAEKRLAALAEVLEKEGEAGQVVLGVVDDMHDQITARGDALKKHRLKVKVLEREIADLHSEFETERTDYLDTIRRLEQQLSLNQQILEKLVPVIKTQYNYGNLEAIRAEAKWDEDKQIWILPEVSQIRTKLPPAGGRELSGSEFDTTRQASAEHNKPDRNEEDDFAGNYFKPKRATELLMKAQEDVARANNYVKTINGYSGSINGIHPSANNLKNAQAQNFLNNSWSGPTTNQNWIDSPARRPVRLEALPLDRKPNLKPQLNTLDVI